MSRAGAKPQSEFMMIPEKPPAVQELELAQRQQEIDAFFGRCTFYARGPYFPHPAIQGAMIANFMVEQMMHAALVAQSKILLPEGVRP